VYFDPENIHQRIFLFSRADGSYSRLVRLLRDGSIGGTFHPNESKWSFEDGSLMFSATSGEVTTIFNTCHFENGGLIAKGVFVGDHSIEHLLTELEWSQRQKNNTLTSVHFSEHIEKLGWTIGDHSYGHPQCYEVGMSRVVIGKYCSISSGVTFILGNHKMNNVSTYPFLSFGSSWPRSNRLESDHASINPDQQSDLVVGNDVWIGHGATIFSGLFIGDGSVIGANSVVTKSCPPYSIIAGNPSRVIRKRFDDVVIRELLDIKWWNWPDSKVDDFLGVMGNVGDFIDKAKGK
jgi:hypothetical protein